MILKILLIIFLILVLFLIIFLFSPIFFTYDNKSKAYSAAVLSIHIIHPIVAKITYIFSVKKYEIVLFNKFIFGSFKKFSGSNYEEILNSNSDKVGRMSI